MTFDLAQLDMKDWVTIMATLLSPLLALQAQKWLERIRQQRGQKTQVFSALLATRQDRLSVEHVRALNMIDIVFYGYKVLNKVMRSKTEQAVLDGWKEYLDHLNTSPGNVGDSNAWMLWNSKGEELLMNLLFAISRDTGYSFDRVQLRRGAYTPTGHGQREDENAKLRDATLKVLTGQSPMKMEVTNMPK